MNLSINTLFRLLGLSLIVLHSCSFQAQELKRKASLGIHMAPMTDSLSSALQSPKGKGLHILNVFPNTTAAQAGMQKDAVLLKVNDVATNSIPALLEAIAELRAGEVVKLQFFQEGRLIEKGTRALGRPMEEAENAEVHYESVNYKGQQLRSILYLPKGTQQPPVVFYLQGYTCGSIDFANFEAHSSLRLIKDWVAAGYAVFRVEKPSVGDSKGEKDCSEINFNEEVEAFRKAYLHLQQDQRIDRQNIFLFGHSMGGVIAPVLASELKPKGVITFGIMVTSWFEYMQELTRVQGEFFHTPYAEIERDLRRSLPFWYKLYVEQQSKEEILKDKQISKTLEEEGILTDFERGQFMGRHYTYWSSLNQLSLVNTWLKVESHTLALYGEFDIQALNDRHIKTIAAIVNSQHPGKGSYKVVPQTDHGFVRFESMEENIATLNNGSYLERMRSDYNPATARLCIEWMNERLD